MDEISSGVKVVGLVTKSSKSYVVLVDRSDNLVSQDLGWGSRKLNVKILQVDKRKDFSRVRNDD